MKILIKCACILMLSLGLCAHVVYAETTLTVAPGVMSFNYEETDVDGSFLDGEHGDIPGVKLSIEELDQEYLFSLGLALEYYAGNVDYTGFIQSTNIRYDGLPLSTTTDQIIFSFSTYIKKPILSDPNLFVYGNLTYKKWERDIQGKFISGIDNFGDPFTNLYVSGLFEVYQWWQMTFGVFSKYSIHKNSEVGFRAGILRTIAPEMDLAAFTFDLQEAWGYEAELSYYHQITQQQRVGISGSIMVWSFGRSNQIGGFVEPDSESEMKTVQLLYELNW